MTHLVLVSGGVSRLAQRRPETVALIAVFKWDGLWPPIVPTVVLAESLSGRQHTDAIVNRLLKTCNTVEELPQHVARRAGIPAGACRPGVGSRRRRDRDGRTRWCRSRR